MVVHFIVFLTLTTLICRGTDISKCFIESLGIRDNESRLYIIIMMMMMMMMMMMILCFTLLTLFKCFTLSTLFKSSRGWKGDNERLCAIRCCYHEVSSGSSKKSTNSLAFSADIDLFA